MLNLCFNHNYLVAAIHCYFACIVFVKFAWKTNRLFDVICISCSHSVLILALLLSSKHAHTVCFAKLESVCLFHSQCSQWFVQVIIIQAFFGRSSTCSFAMHSLSYFIRQ